MIDDLTKSVQDRWWDRVGRVFASAGLTANHVTWASTALVVANAAAFPLHGRAIGFVVALALFELLDNVDGAIARVTGTRSKTGAYLDAMTDRVKDMVTLASVACVYDAWEPAFFGVAGANITSYAKARAGMEVRLDNRGWPDLFERLERIAYVVVMLIVAEVWSSRRTAVVTWGMWAFAGLTLLTAAQRFHRARARLREHDARERRE